MKHKLFKRITTLLVSMVMMLTMIPTKVFGATSTSVIDPTMDGQASLKITKKDSEGNPIEGVGYTLYRVAEITQGEIEDNEVSVIYKSLMDSDDKDENDVPLPDNLVGEGDSDINNKAEELYTYIKTKVFNEGAGLIEEKNWQQDTDENGKISFTNLPLGVYLVHESKLPNGVKMGQSFIVSIPMTVQDGNGKLTTWNYDIEATPKNYKPSIDKSILMDEGNTELPSDDTLSKGEDYQIGDTVPYQIRANIPSNIEELTSFYITDTISEGLDFNFNNENKSNLKVYTITKDTDGKDIKIQLSEYDDATNEGHYDIDINGRYFKVNFKPAALKDYSNVYIEYTATLNENAEIGTDNGNDNKVYLYYNDPSSGTLTKVDPIEDIPKVYTHALTLTKTGEESTTLLKGVEFELRDAFGNKIKVSRGTDGEYVINPDATEQEEAVITTKDDGTVTIKGLNDGQYQLVETKTHKDYVLLKEPIIVNIKSTLKQPTYTPDKVDANGNPVPVLDSNREYFKIESLDTEYYTKIGDDFVKINIDGYSSSEYVRFMGNVYKMEDGSTTKELVPKYSRSTKSNELVKVESNYNVTDGVITLTVVNKKGFNLPQTGGMGTYVFTIGGLLMVVASVAMFIFSKKKTA